MKLGVFTVSMPEYSPKEAVGILKELGYDGVEWRVAPISKSDEETTYENRYWHGNKCTWDINRIKEEAEKIRDICRNSQMEILGLTTYLKPCEYSAIEKVLEAAVKMECKQIRVFTPEYDETEEYNKLFEETVKDVQVLEKLAKKYNVKIVFEIHMDNILASPSAAYRLISNFDPHYIGVIYDPGNMVFEGFENYKKSFELLGEYIAHIHIKNGKMEACGVNEKGITKWKRVWTPLKEGSADLEKFIQVLKEKNYSGNISIEDFSNEKNTYEKMKYNLEYLKELLETGEDCCDI